MRYKVTIMRNKVAIAQVRIMSHKVTLCDIKQYVDNIDAVERLKSHFEIDHIVIYKAKVAIHERVTLCERKNDSYLIKIFNYEAEMCFHVI